MFDDLDNISCEHICSFKSISYEKKKWKKLFLTFKQSHTYTKTGNKIWMQLYIFSKQTRNSIFVLIKSLEYIKIFVMKALRLEKIVKMSLNIKARFYFILTYGFIIQSLYKCHKAFKRRLINRNGLWLKWKIQSN